MTTLQWIRAEVRWKRRHGREVGCSWGKLIWSMLWWPGEEHPVWVTRAIFFLRRLWYRKRTQRCVCPGCTHDFPAWYSNNLCECCTNADCCHEEEE
jgi:hypothetical protein